LHKPEFVYFPRFLVATGKPILFGHDENFITFIKNQKGGRLLGSYMDLMWRAVSTSSGGQTAINTQFDHRSNTFLRVTEFEEKIPDELLGFQVLKTEVQRGITPFIIGRLGSKLISETEIKMKLNEMEYLFNEKLPIKATVGTMALRNRDFSEGTIRSFISKWRSNSILLKFRYHERYYDRDKVESYLRSCHPLRVSIPLGIEPSEDEKELKKDLRLERDRDTEILWEWVLSDPSDLDSMPRALVRDDLPLLRANPHILSVERLLVVSNDLKMVQQISTLRSWNWRSHKTTYICGIEKWIQADCLPGSHFNATDEVVVDMGSLDGVIARLSDEELEPLRTGLRLEDFSLIRPTRSHNIQEVSEYDTLLDILRLPEPSWD
jgi:hypothetical protein